MLKKLTLILAATVLLTACSSSPDQAMKTGFQLYEQGNYKEALPQLQAALKGEIDDPELIVRLAYCMVILDKDPEAAITLLRESTLRHPDYARTYYQLGHIAFLYGAKENKQNLEQALRFTLKAAELDPLDFKILDNAGMFHMLIGNLDSALTWFDAARKINPGHAELNRRIEQTRELLRQKEIQDSILTADTLKLIS